MALEAELKTYRRELPRLLGKTGRFVVVKGEAVLGDFGSYEDALRHGYRECGLSPFLVKQVRVVEPIYFV